MFAGSSDAGADAAQAEEAEESVATKWRGHPAGECSSNCAALNQPPITARLQIRLAMAKELFHSESDVDLLDADKLGLKNRLAIFQQHGDDFLEVAIEFVQRHALCVRPGETRHKPDKKLGIGTTLYDGGISSHDTPRLAPVAILPSMLCSAYFSSVPTILLAFAQGPPALPTRPASPPTARLTPARRA